MRWITNTNLLILDGKKLTIIDTDSSEQKIAYTVKNRSAPKAELSPDCTMLAFVEKINGLNTITKVIELSSGKTLKTIASGTKWPTALQWSPDSKELAYAEDKHIKIYDFVSGKERTLLKILNPNFLGYQLVFGNNVVGYLTKSKPGANKTLHFIKADTGIQISRITLEYNGNIWLLDDDCTFVCETGF